MVFMHHSIEEANRRLAKRTGRINYLTPRHYLDFIKQFVSLLGQKHEELEEQQLHLNVGLQKLLDTQTQVTALQQSLNAKNKELEAKNLLSQEKLKQMLADQKIAEQKQVVASELKIKIEAQNIEIAGRKTRAEADLVSKRTNHLAK
jgi:dynein heavy chain 1